MKHNYKYLCPILFVIMSLLNFNCSDMVGPMGFDFGGRIPDPGEVVNHNIYIMDADGSNQSLILSSDGRNEDPIFSPDGSKILFGYDQLNIMDVDGSNIIDLRCDGNSHQFSPDGSKIIYIFNHESIYMADMDDPVCRGDNHKELTKGISGPSAPGIRPYGPRFSPDGSKIFFVLYESNEEYTNIWVMDTDGSNRRNITNGLLGRIEWRDVKINISPDGLKIVFDIYPHYWSGPDATRADIYTIDIDGNNLIKLTDKGSEPTFSPDGSKIVFESERDENCEIYIMNADGSDQTNLTNNPVDDWNPKFSPDGSKILFLTSRDGNDEIYIMNVDGSNQINLTRNEEKDLSPQFSPDGSKIVFSRERTEEI